MNGSMAMELQKFRPIYEQKKNIKAQALADFVMEMTRPKVEQPIKRE